MQFTTDADVPRVKCATHGVKQLRVPPDAEQPHVRFDEKGQETE